MKDPAKRIRLKWGLAVAALRGDPVRAMASEEEGGSRGENDTLRLVIHGDGTIDIHATDMADISVDALEYIAALARARRKAAFDETT